MISTRTQWIVGSIFGAVIIVGLLAADGLFSKTLTVVSPISHASSQISTFGPPTRTELIAEEDGTQILDIVAEPLYVDVRIPVFFDEAEVRFSLGNLPWPVAQKARIGVEYGQGSGHIRFFETTMPVRRSDPPGSDTELVAVIPVGEVPTPGNRMRVVLSLPDFPTDQRAVLQDFRVTARRTTLFAALRHRLGL